MAATLVLHNNAKAKVVNALKEQLRYVFLGTVSGRVSLGTTLTNEFIQNTSSDGSYRVKQPRISTTTTEYKTQNTLQIDDESRITNFYISKGLPVDKLVLMDSLSQVHGIITFPTITPTETKSLYVPEIKINVL